MTEEGSWIGIPVIGGVSSVSCKQNQLLNFSEKAIFLEGVEKLHRMAGFGNLGKCPSVILNLTSLISLFLIPHSNLVCGYLWAVRKLSEEHAMLRNVACALCL